MLEEIVVTSRRIEESQQDVPQAITALTNNLLLLQGIFQVRDLAENVPSFTTRRGK